jgi:hypothetical protein
MCRLYSLSTVLAEDTNDIMKNSEMKLSTYLVAILRAILAEAGFAAHAQLVFRVAVHAADGVGKACCSNILDLILSAIEQAAPSAQLFVLLLPVFLGKLVGPEGTELTVLQSARAQEALERLCALQWPSSLAHVILTSLKRVSLSAAQQHLIVQAGLRACVNASAEHFANIARATVALDDTQAAVPTLHALCRIMDGQPGGGDQQGGGTSVDGADEMAAAHVELREQLTSLFTRDKALTNSWLKDVKRKLPTSQAALALTIGIAAVPRSPTAVFDALKSALLALLKEAETIEASTWLTKLKRTRNTDGCCGLSSIGRLFQRLASSKDAGLAMPLMQTAMHFISSGSLKGCSVAQLCSCAGEAGLEWWRARGPPASRLCLAGVGLLQQVSHS